MFIAQSLAHTANRARLSDELVECETIIRCRKRGRVAREIEEEKELIVSQELSEELLTLYKMKRRFDVVKEGVRVSWPARACSLGGPVKSIDRVTAEPSFTVQHPHDRTTTIYMGDPEMPDWRLD